MISVIIPTYKEPEALDLCLNSAITGQKNKNQIIVVVDGFFNLNKEVLEKYKEHIDVLNIEENVGMIRAMNLGHYNASYDLVFHVQDDNVFPEAWDQVLLENYNPGYVLTPNQIEPTPSMFKQFHIKDLGRDPKTFNINDFWEYDFSITNDTVEESGSTFPFLINKHDYLRVGGFDETYPGPWTVDWEFFLKCKLSGMKMMRTYNCHFYHFVSLGTAPTPEKQQEKRIKEIACAEYAQYKWGSPIYSNPENNIKFIL
jgi:glycosyltransferase involved in cell wall biosynthesis